MTDYQTTSAIAFFIFNRPALTQQVFAAIRAAKPSRLYVVADGPRPSHADDAARCAATRAIIEQVDWPCEVQTNFATHNLNCGERISTGIAWVFEQVEEAIFLEDDCLPHPSFFRYCDELLARYRDRADVMMISGTNELVAWRADEQSYHFSLAGSIWGWASWRRAWDHYDYQMRDWPSAASRARLAAVLSDEAQVEYRARLCDLVVEGKIDTWDYQWSYARLRLGGLCITPAKNLVSNLGFGLDATHTTRARAFFANLPRHEMYFPLRPPANAGADVAYDAAQFQWRIHRPTAPLVEVQVQHFATVGENFRALQLLDMALAGAFWDAVDDATLSRLYLRRAQVLQAMQRLAYATRDLEHALRLDAENEAARSLHANLKARQEANA